MFQVRLHIPSIPSFFLFILLILFYMSLIIDIYIIIFIFIIDDIIFVVYYDIFVVYNYLFVNINIILYGIYRLITWLKIRMARGRFILLGCIFYIRNAPAFILIYCIWNAPALISSFIDSRFIKSLD